MCYLSSDSWQEWKDRISEILSDSNVMNKLIKNEELCGHLQPGGKITFNQTLNEKSFAQFTKVINDIVPFDVVISGDTIISLADVLDETEVNVYTNYININATLDEYDELDLEENVNNLTLFLEDLSDLEEKPTVALAILRNENLIMAHAIALIIWKENDIHQVAYFDPLAYRKFRENKLIEYNFAPIAFKSEYFDLPIEFINLGELCYHPNSTEFNCTQYIIDADYCYLYALHFIVEWINRWILNNKIFDMSVFQSAVNDTYIVNPSKLTRCSSPESVIYRVIIISFSISSLRCYLLNHPDTINNSSDIQLIEKFNKRFNDAYGFSLLLN